jgi:hypothetical protein
VGRGLVRVVEALPARLARLHNEQRVTVCNNTLQKGDVYRERYVSGELRGDLGVNIQLSSVHSIFQEYTRVLAVSNQSLIQEITSKLRLS